MSGKKHSCHVAGCTHSFFIEESLQKHLSTDHGIGEWMGFKCPHCSTYCQRRNNLKNHIAAMHENKTFECDLCPAVFRWRSGLREHAQYIHQQGGTKVYSCDQCDFTSTKSSITSKHVRRKHKRHSFYICMICCSEWCNTSDFKRHLATHAADVIKGYPCIKCNDKLTSPNELFIHIVHKHLYNELTAAWEKIDESASITSNVPNLIITNAQGTWHTCFICSHKLTKHYEMLLHVKRHFGLPPFTCTECDKGFKSKFNMQMHWKSHGNQNKPKRYRNPSWNKDHKIHSAGNKTTTNNGIRNCNKNEILKKHSVDTFLHTEDTSDNVQITRDIKIANSKELQSRIETGKQMQGLEGIIFFNGKVKSNLSSSSCVENGKHLGSNSELVEVSQSNSNNVQARTPSVLTSLCYRDHMITANLVSESINIVTEDDAFTMGEHRSEEKRQSEASGAAVSMPCKSVCGTEHGSGEPTCTDVNGSSNEMQEMPNVSESQQLSNGNRGELQERLPSIAEIKTRRNSTHHPNHNAHTEEVGNINTCEQLQNVYSSNDCLNPYITCNPQEGIGSLDQHQTNQVQHSDATNQYYNSRDTYYTNVSQWQRTVAANCMQQPEYYSHYQPDNTHYQQQQLAVYNQYEHHQPQRHNAQWNVSGSMAKYQQAKSSCNYHHQTIQDHSLQQHTREYSKGQHISEYGQYSRELHKLAYSNHLQPPVSDYYPQHVLSYNTPDFNSIPGNGAQYNNQLQNATHNSNQFQGTAGGIGLPRHTGCDMEQLQYVTTNYYTNSSHPHSFARTAEDIQHSSYYYTNDGNKSVPQDYMR